MMVYVADTVEEAHDAFAEPVIWYYRTIAKYIAPPQGEAPIPGYEMYTQTRDLAASVSWDQLLQRQAVVCGNADYVVEELVPFLSSRVNVIDGRDGRGVFRPCPHEQTKTVRGRECWS